MNSISAITINTIKNEKIHNYIYIFIFVFFTFSRRQIQISSFLFYNRNSQKPRNISVRYIPGSSSTSVSCFSDPERQLRSFGALNNIFGLSDLSQQFVEHLDIYEVRYVRNSSIQIVTECERKDVFRQEAKRYKQN